jgi:hypothetical protein
LGYGGDGADEGVLIAYEFEIGLQAKDSAIAEDGFVEDLEEVDPDEDGEDGLVGFAADAFVLHHSVYSHS